MAWSFKEFFLFLDRDDVRRRLKDITNKHMPKIGFYIREVESAYEKEQEITPEKIREIDETLLAMQCNGQEVLGSCSQYLEQKYGIHVDYGYIMNEGRFRITGVWNTGKKFDAKKLLKLRPYFDRLRQMGYLVDVNNSKPLPTVLIGKRIAEVNIFRSLKIISSDRSKGSSLSVGGSIYKNFIKVSGDGLFTFLDLTYLESLSIVNPNSLEMLDVIAQKLFDQSPLPTHKRNEIDEKYNQLREKILDSL